MLRAAGVPFPGHAAVGGVRHLRQTSTSWTAAGRRVPALRSGCLTVLKPLLTEPDDAGPRAAGCFVDVVGGPGLARAARGRLYLRLPGHPDPGSQKGVG